jgi:hypothetical protein
MAEIMRALLGAGLTPAAIEHRLSMEPEELTRLAERAGIPIIVGRETAAFEPGWVPGKE